MSTNKSTAPVLFSDLQLSASTLKGLNECNYRELTEIQRRTIGWALQGYDIVAAAKTGSGKTLAFLVPIIEHLYNEKWEKNHGLRALIIAPVRELAQQIYDVLGKVAKYHDVSIGLIIGGKGLGRERKNIDCCNILIGTPGRILQHMDETFIFNCSYTKYVVLDEADRCLDMGFKQQMDSIIENLPAERQTLLFSATQTKSVEDLARLSLKKNAKYISVHEHATYATPDGLQQLYMICNLGDKLSLLWSFLRRHQKHKIVVFFSTCQQVKFVHEAFRQMKPRLTMGLLALYGTLHQERRLKIYAEFGRKQHAVMFATDIASRGLDFSNVTWIVQMDCPEDVQTYIHRAGRSARMNKGGESLLVLLPSELKMIEKLQSNNVPIKQSKVNHKELQPIQKQLEAWIGKYPNHKECAQRALKTYVKSVFYMKDKSIFDFKALDTDSFARSLGLSETPRVRALERREKNEAKKKRSKNKDGESSDEDVKKIDINHKNEISTFHDDDDESDDCLTIKRKNVQIDDNEDSELENTCVSKKVVTKAAAAKKTLRKNIVPNKKINFDEEGQEIIDPAKSKVSNLGREYENEETSGINITVAREILKEEDKVDKLRYQQKIREKHREEKMKRKALKKGQKDEEDNDDADESYDSGEESSESESLNQLISDLPDPDKIYGKKENTSDEESDNDGEDVIHRSKRKLVTLDEIENKRQKSDSSDDEDDNEVQHSLKTDEELALQLLRG
ncbi:probable ATP-dependent RNA helicase DDX10 [Trichogramma pretiosum]|uniref:probable ATP-dependent RNA helicase DDX10 n=1 Tax=Trichogramma pretiosum TaxID=7493 RepID=UPI000C718A17|nr:probable ATP-dependent RNA helicase DDX10 [Trichogramma pretiosum]